MKPILGIDITDDKNNSVINGENFVTASVSKDKYDKFVEKQESFDATLERSKTPLWTRIVKAVCGIYALLVVAAVIRAGFGTAFKNAPYLVISAGVCAVIWVALQIYAIKKQKRVLEEENASGQLENIDAIANELYAELNIPSLAETVDVLMFRYTVKDGEICPKTLGFQSTPYINLSAKAYRRDDTLYVADLEKVYSFNLSEIRTIRTVNKRISVPSWNKDEDPKSDEYCQYKMTVNNMGDVFFKPYHILEIEREGELYGLYFPCYELDVFERLTGIAAEK